MESQSSQYSTFPLWRSSTRRYKIECFRQRRALIVCHRRRAHCVILTTEVAAAERERASVRAALDYRNWSTLIVHERRSIRIAASNGRISGAVEPLDDRQGRPRRCTRDGVGRAWEHSHGAWEGGWAILTEYAPSPSLLRTRRRIDLKEIHSDSIYNKFT